MIKSKHKCIFFKTKFIFLQLMIISLLKKISTFLLKNMTIKDILFGVAFL